MGLLNDLLCVGIGVGIGYLLLRPKAPKTPPVAPKNPVEDMLKKMEELKKKMDVKPVEDHKSG